MHKELLQFLACPICRTSLTFDGKAANNRFVNGYLKCSKGHLYQVKEEIGLIKDARLSAKEFKWKVNVADESKYEEIQKQYNSYLSEDLKIALKKLMEMLVHSVSNSCKKTDNMVLDIASGWVDLFYNWQIKAPQTS